MLGRIADQIIGATQGTAIAGEEVDPAVKAFQEIAQPMARGYQLLAGDRGEKKKEGWFRKIYASLSGMRREESDANRAANRSLRNLENRPVDAGDSGSGWLALLAGIPLIGPMIVAALVSLGATLLAVLSKLPLIGRLFSGAGAAGAAGGAGGAGAAGGAARAGGLLRKIPLIGVLFGGLSAANAIAGSEEDGSKTRREKDTTAGNALGGFAGSVGGMMAGAKLGAMAGALGGPVGIAIGGVVGGVAGMFFGDQAGQIVGEKVGGWASV